MVRFTAKSRHDNPHSKAYMTELPTPQNQNEEAEGLIRSEDIHSTSRSCLVIIVVAVAIVLLLCVFVVVQTWVR